MIKRGRMEKSRSMLQKSRSMLTGLAPLNALDVIIAIAMAMAAALIVFVILQQSVGFDFSDEGFYLNWITDPSQYGASVTQFGFIYHPLFQLVGNDVAALRYLSRAIELLLAVAVFYILIKQIERPGSRQIRWQRCALALALATSVMASCQDWLPTPSYNSLNLQGLLVLVLGLLMIDDDRGVGRPLCGAVLVGFGGWLCFMAKPTTAVLLGPLVIVYLLVATPHRWLCLWSRSRNRLVLDGRHRTRRRWLLSGLHHPIPHWAEFNVYRE